MLSVCYKRKYIRQSEIARHIKQKPQNVSLAMHKLEKEGLIKCISEEDKKAWKIYIITDLGKEVWQFVKKQVGWAKKRK